MEHKWSERQKIKNTIWKREQWKLVKQCNLTSQVRKTKQKEEKCKNTNKIKDVRIMKNIIQIYNNLRVLWSSNVKFVSLSNLFGWLLFGSNWGLFIAPGFIVSLVGIKKKRNEGRANKKGNKGKNVEWIKKKEGKKGRRSLKKFKKNKRETSADLIRPSQFCWSSWLQQAEGELVYLFSLLSCNLHRCPASSPVPQFGSPVPFCTQPMSSVHKLRCPWGAPIRGSSHTTFSIFAVLGTRESQSPLRVVQPLRWVKSFWGLLTSWDLKFSSVGVSLPSY